MLGDCAIRCHKINDLLQDYNFNSIAINVMLFDYHSGTSQLHTCALGLSLYALAQQQFLHVESNNF